MNLRRFQFAVNHQDPTVVLAGLREFLDQLLVTEQSLQAFFCAAPCGSSSDAAFGAVEYPLVQSMLATFFESSPQAEEFFSLWDFPTIEYDAELCATDMDCLAAVIECLPKTSPFLMPIINRINSTCSKFILFQLDKKNAALRNSVLRLLISVQRKGRLADDFLHHLMLSNLMKSAAKKADKDADHDGDEDVNDKLYFVIKMLFTALLHSDTDMAQQLLTYGNNVEALVNGLSAMSRVAYDLFLAGVVALCEKGARIQDALVQKLLTGHAVQSVLSAADASSAKQDDCGVFLEKLTLILTTQVISSDQKHARTGLSSHVARKILHLVVAVLTPVGHPVHAKVQVEIVRALPDMCRRCVQTMKTSWEPVDSEDYLGALRHLNDLVSSDCTAVSADVAESAGALQNYIGLPSGLGKQEFGKIIAHSVPELQLAGLALVRTVLRKMRVASEQSATSGASRSSFRVLQEVSAVKLPEISAILAVRPRLFAAYMASKGFESAQPDGAAVPSAATTGVLAVDDDIEMNFEGDEPVDEAVDVTEPATDAVTMKTNNTAELAVVALLECVALVCRLVPASCALLKHDLPKLLDELFPGDITFTAATSEDSENAVAKALLLLLRESVGLCSWFGTDDDNSKLLNNALVQPDWQATSTKRFVLTKLRQHIHSEDLEGFLCELLCESSGLFVGHGAMDYDLLIEAWSWLSVCKSAEAMVLLETVLRLSWTWNIEIVEEAQKLLPGQALVCSPVLYCGLFLVAGHWRVFTDRLPKFFQAYLLPGTDGEQGKTAEQKANFLAKFVATFSTPFQTLLEQVILQQAYAARDAPTFAAGLSALCDALLVTSPLFKRTKSFVKALAAHGLVGCVSAVQPSQPVDMLRGSRSVVDHVLVLSQHLEFVMESRSKTTNAEVEAVLTEFWPTLSTSYLHSLLQRLKANAALSKFSGSTLTWIAGQWTRGAGRAEQIASAQRLAVLPVVTLLEQLRLLDGTIHNVLVQKDKSPQHLALEAPCFALSDLLCSLVIRALEDVASQPHIALQIASVPNLREGLTQTNAFGMICRKGFAILAPVLATHGGSPLLEKAAQSLLQHWPASPQRVDASYVELASAIASSGGGGPAAEASERRAQNAQLQDLESLVKVMVLPQKQTALIEPLAVPTKSLLRAMTPMQLQSLLQRFIVSEECGELSALLPIVSSSHGRFSAFYAFALVDVSSELAQAMDIALSKGVAGLRLVRMCATVLQGLGSSVSNIASSTVSSSLGHWILRLLAASALQSFSQSLAGAQLGDKLKAWLLSVAPGDDEFPSALGAVVDLALAASTPLCSRVLAALVQDSAWGFDGCRQGQILLEVVEILQAPVPSALLTFYGKHSVRVAKDDSQSAVAASASARRVVRACGLGAHDAVQVDKWLKLVLKYRFEDAPVHAELLAFFRQARDVVGHDWKKPVQVLGLVVTHTRFAVLLEAHDNSARVSKTAVLQTLLLLLSWALEVARDEALAAVDKCRSALLGAYGSSLARHDRILLRILWNLELHSDASTSAESLLLIRPKATSSLQSWVLAQIKPAKVYATLAAFPTQRGLVPLPFAWESPRTEALGAAYMEAFMRALGSAETWTCVDADVDGGATEVLGEVYDPTFLLPLIVETLQREDPSIKGLLNSGAVSLLLMSLSSQCPGLRGLALAGLQALWAAVHSEEAEKDKSFRERVQVNLLLAFVRNAIGESEDGGLDLVAAPLPVSTALFLARAALHLMQPLHALYGKINRYLINRKHADPKDVPLLDLLVTQAESPEDRLQGLRLLRDGLRTHADHLNFCRKHAYTRLLLMFHIHMGDADVRVGQALLDVLGQALTIREASHYLLDKCQLLPWLAHTFQDCWAHYIEGQQALGPREHGVGRLCLPRLLQLLRRGCGAVLLLQRQGLLHDDMLLSQLRDALQPLVKRCFEDLSAVGGGVQEVAEALLVTLWDFSLACREVGRADLGLPLATLALSREVVQRIGKPGDRVVRVGALLLLGLHGQGGDLDGAQARKLFQDVLGASIAHAAGGRELPSGVIVGATARMDNELAGTGDGAGRPGDGAGSAGLLAPDLPIATAWALMGATYTERSWLASVVDQVAASNVSLLCVARTLRALWPSVPVADRDAFRAWHLCAMRLLRRETVVTGASHLRRLQDLLADDTGADFPQTVTAAIAANLQLWAAEEGPAGLRRLAYQAASPEQCLAMVHSTVALKPARSLRQSAVQSPAPEEREHTLHEPPAPTPKRRRLSLKPGRLSL